METMTTRRKGDKEADHPPQDQQGWWGMAEMIPDNPIDYVSFALEASWDEDGGGGWTDGDGWGTGKGNWSGEPLSAAAVVVHLHNNEPTLQASFQIVVGLRQMIH